MIQRNKYLSLLIASKEDGFPKVITGIRRCGKSFLLKEIYINYLYSIGVKKDNILYIDLNLISNSNYRDPIYLYEYVISKIKKDKMNYVIIDEIQEVYNIINLALTDGKHIKASDKDEEVITFVDVVLDLASKRNIDLYITGSNSRMLSTDIQTEFRDKATIINIKPLSFEEYYDYTKQDPAKAIIQYMTYGGMPLAVLKDKEQKKNYLKSLFETTYLKDIIEKHGFRKTEALDELCTLLATTTGNLINASELSKEYVAKTHNKIDPDTVEAYIDAFKESFIINEATRYDIKGKKIISSTKKYYYIDTGLRNARINYAYIDEGQMLENIVYNELLYNDYTVNVGTFDTFENDENGKTLRKSLEIDFIAVKGNRKYYIQVSSDISNADTKKREIKPYIALSDSIQKIIVVNKDIEETRDENEFIVIGITDFLLRFIK